MRVVFDQSNAGRKEFSKSSHKGEKVLGVQELARYSGGDLALGGFCTETLFCLHETVAPVKAEGVGLSGLLFQYNSTRCDERVLTLFMEWSS